MAPKNEEKVVKKEKIIIDALKSCLQRDVYSKITVQDIANESGFSKGGVLHYFSTKEDIYLALVEELFSDIEKSHRAIFEWQLESESMAPMSALVGIENFIMDKKNLKIVMNLMLYAFEEEKIMKAISEFIAKQRLFYYSIIPKEHREDLKRKSDIDPKTLAKIAQTIVLFIGVAEIMDPVGIEHIQLIKFISSLLKTS
jgi:AcrR family transcriptional regulator